MVTIGLGLVTKPRRSIVVDSADTFSMPSVEGKRSPAPSEVASVVEKNPGGLVTGGLVVVKNAKGSSVVVEDDSGTLVEVKKANGSFVEKKPGGFVISGLVVVTNASGSLVVEGFCVCGIDTNIGVIAVLASVLTEPSLVLLVDMPKSVEKGSKVVPIPGPKVEEIIPRVSLMKATMSGGRVRGFSVVGNIMMENGEDAGVGILVMEKSVLLSGITNDSVVSDTDGEDDGRVTERKCESLKN